MKRPTLSDIEYGMRKRTTKREEFLRIMDQSIPWDEWVAYIEPYYPKGTRGRPPMGIEKMLRMYLLQCWFNLSVEGIEDAIYDSYAMRIFMRVNFFDEQVPDATTLLKFRHLLEEHNIGKAFFDAIAGALAEY
jgi:IS5 family transposase